MILPTLSPEEALIFRITHRDNLPWILHHGLFAKSSQVLDPNFRKIGDLDLIDKRSRHVVPAGPRGTLGGYIPFYFTPFSIMMLQNQYRAWRYTARSERRACHSGVIAL